MRRQLAVELGPHGIRVITLRSGGVPESLPERMGGREEIVGPIVAQTMLGRARRLGVQPAGLRVTGGVRRAPAVSFVDSRVNDTGAA